MFILLLISYVLASNQNLVLDSRNLPSGTSNTDILVSAVAASTVKQVGLSVFHPVSSLPPNVHCTLGVALVKAIGNNPTIQLINGQPLVVPQVALIASQVWEFTTLDDDVQTNNAFFYNSVDDPFWTGIQLNSGNQLRLLTILDCNAPVQVIYSGIFNWR